MVALSSLLQKITAPDHLFNLQADFIDRFRQVQANAKRYARYYLDEARATALHNLGIGTDPTAAVAHPHAASKTIEEFILNVVLPPLLNEDASVYCTKEFKAVGLQENCGVGITLMNTVYNARDYARYEGYQGFEYVAAETPLMVFHDVAHYLSPADIAQVFRAKAHTGYFTVVYPPELLVGVAALDPNLYNFTVADDTITFMPDGHGPSAYHQPLAGKWWFTTSTIYDGDVTVNIQHLASYGAHHVFMATTRPCVPANRITLGLPALVRIPTPITAGEQNEKPVVPREVAEMAMNYANSVSKLSHQQLHARLTMYLSSTNKARVSPSNREALVRHVMAHLSAKVTYEDYATLPITHAHHLVTRTGIIRQIRKASWYPSGAAQRAHGLAMDFEPVDPTLVRSPVYLTADDQPTFFTRPTCPAIGIQEFSQIVAALINTPGVGRQLTYKDMLGGSAANGEYFSYTERALQVLFRLLVIHLMTSNWQRYLPAVERGVDWSFWWVGCVFERPTLLLPLTLVALKFLYLVLPTVCRAAWSCAARLAAARTAWYVKTAWAELVSTCPPQLQVLELQLRLMLHPGLVFRVQDLSQPIELGNPDDSDSETDSNDDEEITPAKDLPGVCVPSPPQTQRPLAPNHHSLTREAPPEYAREPSPEPVANDTVSTPCQCGFPYMRRFAANHRTIADSEWQALVTGPCAPTSDVCLYLGNVAHEIAYRRPPVAVVPYTDKKALCMLIDRCWPLYAIAPLSTEEPAVALVQRRENAPPASPQPPPELFEALNALEEAETLRYDWPSLEPASVVAQRSKPPPPPPTGNYCLLTALSESFGVTFETMWGCYAELQPHKSLHYSGASHMMSAEDLHDFAKALRCSAYLTVVSGIRRTTTELSRCGTTEINITLAAQHFTSDGPANRQEPQRTAPLPSNVGDINCLPLLGGKELKSAPLPYLLQRVPPPPPTRRIASKADLSEGRVPPAKARTGSRKGPGKPAMTCDLPLLQRLHRTFGSVSHRHVVDYKRAEELRKNLESRHWGKEIHFEKNSGVLSAMRSVLQAHQARERRPVHISGVLGLPGSGKSYAMMQVLRQQLEEKPKATAAFRLINPTLELRTQAQHRLNPPQGYGFLNVTLEKPFIQTTAPIVIIDEIGKFPPGYLDLLLAMRPEIEHVFYTGDPAQGVYHCPSAGNTLNGMKPEIDHVAPYAYTYLMKTHRLAQETASALGLATTTALKGGIHIVNTPPAACPVICATRAQCTAYADLGRKAVSFPESQGWEADSSVLIKTDNYTAMASDRAWFTALTRTKRSVLVFNSFNLATGSSHAHSSAIGQAAVSGDHVALRTAVTNHLSKYIPKHLRDPLRAPKTNSRAHLVAQRAPKTAGRSMSRARLTELVGGHTAPSRLNRKLPKDTPPLRALHPFDRAPEDEPAAMTAAEWKRLSSMYDALDSKFNKMGKYWRLLPHLVALWAPYVCSGYGLVLYPAMAFLALVTAPLAVRATFVYSVHSLLKEPALVSQQVRCTIGEGDVLGRERETRKGMTAQVDTTDWATALFLRHNPRLDDATATWGYDKRYVKAKPDNTNLTLESGGGAIMFSFFMETFKPRFPQVFDETRLSETETACDFNNFLNKGLAQLKAIASRADPSWALNYMDVSAKKQDITKPGSEWSKAKASQMINSFSTQANFLFGPLAKYMTHVVQEALPPNVFIMNETTKHDFESFILGNWDFSRISSEDDYTGYDCTQGLPFLQFYVLLMRACLVPEHMVQGYIRFSTCCYSFLGPAGFFMTSGNKFTFPFNTFGSLAYQAMRYKIPPGVAICAAGDDIAVNTDLQQRDSWTWNAHKFKLECKPVRSLYPKFCGWLIVPTGVIRIPSLIYARTLFKLRHGKIYECALNYADDIEFMERNLVQLAEYLGPFEVECHEATYQILRVALLTMGMPLLGTCLDRPS